MFSQSLASGRICLHLLIQWGVQYIITLFLGMRGIEGTKQLKVKDLVKVDSDPDVEFSYWREVTTYFGVVNNLM